MPFSTIPNELVLEIAANLRVSEVSRLARTTRTLKCLLSPLLVRRLESHHVSRCITRNLPCSLQSILRSNTINLDHRTRLPGSDFHGWPLEAAASRKCPELVSILLDHGAVIDEPEHGDTPLRLTTLQGAVLSGCVRTVALLLDAGANINRVSEREKDSPLCLATQECYLAVSDLLIDRGAELSGSVFVRAAYVANLPVLNRLLDMGVPVDILYSSMQVYEPVSALQYICMLCPRNVCWMAEILLNRGADVNRENSGPCAFSSLYSAVRRDHAPLVKLLLLYGADKSKIYLGQSLLEFAGDTDCRAVLEAVE